MKKLINSWEFYDADYHSLPDSMRKWFASCLNVLGLPPGFIAGTERWILPNAYMDIINMYSYLNSIY